MTEPVTGLISLLGVPGAACEGDDCFPNQPPADDARAADADRPPATEPTPVPGPTP